MMITLQGLVQRFLITQSVFGLFYRSKTGTKSLPQFVSHNGMSASTPSETGTTSFLFLLNLESVQVSLQFPSITMIIWLLQLFR